VARSGSCKDDIYLEFISLEENQFKKVGKKKDVYFSANKFRFSSVYFLLSET